MTPFPSGTAVSESCIHQIQCDFQRQRSGVLEAAATASELKSDAMIRPTDRFFKPIPGLFAEVLPGGKRNPFMCISQNRSEQRPEICPSNQGGFDGQSPFHTWGLMNSPRRKSESPESGSAARDSCMGATRGILR